MSSHGRPGFVLALLLCGFVLASCGKKASHVEAPPDVEVDHYPLIYPDPATDPKPVEPKAE